MMRPMWTTLNCQSITFLRRPLMQGIISYYHGNFVVSIKTYLTVKKFEVILLLELLNTQLSALFKHIQIWNLIIG